MFPTVFKIGDGGAEDAEPIAEEAAETEAELGADTEADTEVADLETGAELEAREIVAADDSTAEASENPGNPGKECEVNIVSAVVDPETK